MTQEALKALWYATYPDQELEGLISEQWKDMGWQGRDPSTDFRYTMTNPSQNSSECLWKCMQL
jgi:hypothetical protein